MIGFHEILKRLVFAALLGGTIGIEREIHRRPAGIRTSMLVCLATALFTIVSVEISRIYGDTSSTRIASNIVQGVGFLGAGAIMKDRAGTVGMTTAATIFAEAAIGMAAGGGLYAVAGASTVIVWFGLFVVAWATTRFNLKPRVMVFRFTATHPENVVREVQQLLAAMKIPAQHFRSGILGTTNTVEFEADVSHSEEQQIVNQLNRQGIITEVLPLEGHSE